jgi:hypothetical protein
MPSLKGFIYQGTKVLVPSNKDYGKYFYHIRIQGDIIPVFVSKAIYRDKDAAEVAAANKIKSGELDHL